MSAVVVIIALVKNKPSIYFIVGLSSPLPGWKKGAFLDVFRSLFSISIRDRKGEKAMMDGGWQ